MLHARPLRYITFLATLALLTGIPAKAQWVDISQQVKKILGPHTFDSPYYLKQGSVKSIKSVNLKGVVYRQGVFSYSFGDQTRRDDLLFQCDDFSYKSDLANPGYWYNMNWITPNFPKTTFQWFAFTYLCGNPSSPWKLVATSVDSEDSYVNLKAAYRFNLGRHGSVFTFVSARHKNDNNLNSDEIFRAYVACKTRSVGFYSLEDAAGDRDIVLEEVNPGSVAESFVKVIC